MSWGLSESAKADEMCGHLEIVLKTQLKSAGTQVIELPDRRNQYYKYLARAQMAPKKDERCNMGQMLSASWRVGRDLPLEE
jgi:hypothetical protein